jgi:hypothetical protein
VVAALLTAAGGRSDPAGVAAFSARAENWGGALVALLGTGGIWNAQAVPVTRTAVVVPVFVAGLVGLGLVGFGTLRRRWGGGAGRLALLGAGALFVSAAGVLPGTAGTLRLVVAHLPGGGLLRDGQKFLIPYALLLAVCVALAAERIAERVGAAPLVLAGFALMPVVMLPDLAWGVGGQLRPVAYPAEWNTVARQVAAAPGPVVSLPMSAYRAYAWNPGSVVYDPASRYLPAEVVMDDRLRIDLGSAAQVIRGESEAAEAAQERVETGGPAADERVRWVLVQRAGGPVPATALAGLTPVRLGPDLQLYRNPGYRAPARHLPVLGAAGYLLAGSVAAIAGWRRFARGRSMRRKR